MGGFFVKGAQISLGTACQANGSPGDVSRDSGQGDEDSSSRARLISTHL